MTAVYQSAAVVDAADGSVIVWQVDMSADAGLTRMSGGWVIDSNARVALRSLTQGRYLVATSTGVKACAKADAGSHAGMIHLALVIDAVAAEISELQATFDRALSNSRTKLIAPKWPWLPPLIDLEDPPYDRNAPGGVAAALGIARWLEALALAWESLEQQRLARRYLRGKETTQRPLPIYVAS